MALYKQWRLNHDDKILGTCEPPPNMVEEELKEGLDEEGKEYESRMEEEGTMRVGGN